MWGRANPTGRRLGGGRGAGDAGDLEAAADAAQAGVDVAAAHTEVAGCRRDRRAGHELLEQPELARREAVEAATGIGRTGRECSTSGRSGGRGAAAAGEGGRRPAATRGGGGAR